MKKFRIGVSFLLLILLCVLLGNILLLLNYLSALILHELAHLYVAIKRGYKLKQFKVGMFGVSIELDETIDNQDAFAINIAGPSFNLLICIVCLAIYYLFPMSFKYLHTFCLSNLILALFNLLPVYPLDGGKIFRGLIKNDKTYKVLDKVIKIIFSIIFFILFVLSGLKSFNWFYLLMSIFFIISKEKQTPTFSLFKRRKPKRFEKVEILKVEQNSNLFDLLKAIKPTKYTIFYCNHLGSNYFTEDQILEYGTKYPLTTTLNKVILNNKQ